MPILLDRTLGRINLSIVSNSLVAIEFVTNNLEVPGGKSAKVGVEILLKAIEILAISIESGKIK